MCVALPSDAFHRLCFLMWSGNGFAIADASQRPEFIFRERFNLSADLRDVLQDGAPDAPVVPAGHGSPFAQAWRNYIKSMFQKGFMYRVSCNPSVILYIAENKTLAGKEDRIYEGEALGRKIAVVVFEDMDGDLVRRVHRETLGMQQVLLSIAEILQTLAPELVPVEPDRPPAQTELMFEALYEGMDILKYRCAVDDDAEDMHVYTLHDEADAELALTH